MESALRQWIKLVESVIGLDEAERRARKLIAAVTRFAKSAGLSIRFKYPAYDAPELEVTDFFATTPGKGAGTKVMIYLCKKADEQEFTIWLMPESRRNIEFYSRFGFESSNLHGNMLVRYAEPKMDDDDREDYEAMRRKGLAYKP